MSVHHSALIHTMVIMSAVDSDIADVELRRMTSIVQNWPVFSDYDVNDLPAAALDSAKMLEDENGLELLLKDVAQNLPAKLYETAYAVACDIAAADGVVTDEESQLLELIRHWLKIERLIAAGIERGARARHTTL